MIAKDQSADQADLGPFEANGRLNTDANAAKSSKGGKRELLSNLVFEDCWSCGDLVGFGFNSVFECGACDDFREVVKAA